MADDTKKQQVPLAPVPTTNVAPTPSNSETVPGGRYIVDGVAVDANGAPLDEKPAAEEG